MKVCNKDILVQRTLKNAEYTCPNCQVVIVESQASPTILCECCMLWFHFSGVGLKKRKEDPPIQEFRCSNCRAEKNNDMLWQAREDCSRVATVLWSQKYVMKINKYLWIEQLINQFKVRLRYFYCWVSLYKNIVIKIIKGKT